MTTHQHHGQWQIVAREGGLRLKTGRIGLISINATAPIVGGEADWTKAEADLTVEIGINEVQTGNRLLDPEVRSLVGKGSDGVLTFKGTGTVQDNRVDFDGRAWAGDVEVPMTLTGEPQSQGEHERDIKITGTATFNDVHIPLPGFSRINTIDVEIEGMLKLIRATADS